ncbi:Protein BCCIP [Chionoecetes opilio]|uniref:Protein BCCIP homolog n=1 Tax=Chionoecetes opilio TaxID=41210 RepID=A0A8J4YQF7_CHIOP|nr:Protein BCCIP [Chionoecetes opilio]
MPGPFKKPRAVYPLEDHNPEESDEDMQQDELIGQTVSNQIDVLGLRINVDFEGFTATDADFHGMKRLLQQCFRGLPVDVSGLTDTIISQNYVGSVIKQVDAEEDDDDEEEEEMQGGEDDGQQVFGVTTVINMTARKDEDCVAGLRTALVERCSSDGPDATTALLRDILGNESKHIGLLVSERLTNLPPQFAIPVFDCLRKEINEAKKKKMPYDFAYLLMICKVYKLEKKKKKRTIETELWGNPEEEVIAEECTASFEYSVKGESSMSGEWDEDDPQYTPFRRVLILEASRLPEIMVKVKQAVQM